MSSSFTLFMGSAIIGLAGLGPQNAATAKPERTRNHWLAQLDYVPREQRDRASRLKLEHGFLLVEPHTKQRQVELVWSGALETLRR